MSRTVCFECGGDFDPRYVNTPCPDCGRINGKLPDEIAKEGEIKTTYNLPNNLKDLVIIPKEYKGIVWAKSNLMREHEDDIENIYFQNLVNNMEKCQQIFIDGKLPASSLILSAPPSFSKITWAYSCMQFALENGHSVAPLLDTQQLKRLIICSSENYKFKLFGNIDYDSYVTKDVLFITVTKTAYRVDAHEVISEIMDIRSRLGLPTFIISRYSLKELSRRDWNKHFQYIVNEDITQNNLKFPIVLSYEKKLTDIGVI